MSVENIKMKQAIIDEIKGKLDKAESAVVIDYLGTTVEQANEMRKKLREANVDYTVYKNTMMARAIDGTPYAPLKDVLTGPSAIAISYDDAIAPARVLAGFIKQYNKMAFKAGVIEGVFYDEDKIKEIATIPSREELIAKFMGSIQSPVGKFVRTLQAVADAKPQVKQAAPDKIEEPASPEPQMPQEEASVSEDVATDTQESAAE
ncbi:MAG: 50S ribosomal protein L10 [Clostridia bacterium]|nr:50S ribosomal protein L10 [Clostridia bacterium]